MKKIYLFILVITCLVITGCNNKAKEAITVDDFVNKGNNLGFIVEDNMNSYMDANYINEAKKATLDNVVIEMIIYDNDDNASKVQEEQIKNFLNIKNAGASINKDKGSNFYKYSMISNGYYVVTSRIDNTLIFSKTLLENKDKVIEYLDSLGY